MNNKHISYLCLCVVVVEIVAIMVVWIASAANPFGSFNNPLSAEGVRWMFRNLMAAMVSKWLVALLLLAMSWGSLKESGLWNAVVQRTKSGGASLHYRERMGLRVVALITLVFVVTLSLLTMLPEALLLSATGGLFPSPFSEAVVPAISLWLTSASITFGIRIVFRGHQPFRPLYCVADAVAPLCQRGQDARKVIFFPTFFVSWQKSVTFAPKNR